MVNHLGTRSSPSLEWIYGVGYPKYNKQIYLNRFRKHNREVMEYFKSRADDLLIVSWEKGDQWDKLCNFLGKPLPDQPFPHTNKKQYLTPLMEIKRDIKTSIKRILKLS